VGDSAAPRPRAPSASVGPEPGWYKDAIFYELHVRAFADGNGDGQGDFEGLTGRLDYLRDLGVTAIWLLPFYPSPLRDDGYDISDYTGVHPAYGTLEDFKRFLGEAHDRGLRVITELVLNHTSDLHPWFQAARRAPAGSEERSFYLWSETPDRFAGARIIFREFETSNWAWDPVARAYYFHRFYAHQPDLNYDRPQVVDAIFGVIDRWLSLGVDGLRLDAVPYLFKREGTTCENLPETHAFLRRLRAHVDANFSDRMLLAEANQWPEDAALYFGSGRGDECHGAFHFPLMPRMFMATRMESRFPLLDILDQTPPIPPDAQWFLFLRNHDELTLEMVSDEERDYMYRMYAADPRARVNLGIRRRLAPLLRNDRRLIELMVGLLLSLPGTPVLYYGDELGMGDNIYLGDRNGVRSPMQWSADRNAGFSLANPQMLYLPVIVDPEYHFQTVNVETQRANPNSLLWYHRRRLALRRQSSVFGRGAFQLLFPENPRVLAFLRRDASEDVLVVANLCHLPQSVDLDLSAFRGARPIELSGPTEFPAIGEGPYRLGLGGHDLYWFRLERPPTSAAAPEPPPTVPEVAGWETVARRIVRPRLESALRRYLLGQRWFRGKADRPSGVSWRAEIPLGPGRAAPHLALVEVTFAVGEPQSYLVPLAFAEGPRAAARREEIPSPVVAAFSGAAAGEPAPVLYDAARDPELARALVDRIAEGRREWFGDRELVASATDAFDRAAWAADRELPVEPVGGEQSNTSVRLGDRYLLKLYRAVGGGVHPELEIGLYLAGRGLFPHLAPVAGFVSWTAPRSAAAAGGGETLAILHRYLPNEGDAWAMTLAELGRYFDRVQVELASAPSAAADRPARSELGRREPTDVAIERIGPYLELARRLGTRTAELHRALATDTADPAFVPEPFDPFYVRAIYQTMQSQRRRSFELLRRNREAVGPAVQPLADAVLALDGRADAGFRALLGRRFRAMRTRIHGDFHLGQLLWTGKDFVVIDFEGEPARPLSERRIKRSPLRDVAGMLRSFDYAAQSAYRRLPAAGDGAADRRRELREAGSFWTEWVSSEYLRAYRAGTEGSIVVPTDPEEFDLLLDAYRLEKALYELGYELQHRPDWTEIPLRGLRGLLEPGP
jgi:maltose alpha-D-glucosyltransferase/alpha-amylase